MITQKHWPAIFILLVGAVVLISSVVAISVPNECSIIQESLIDPVASHSSPLTGGIVIGGYAFDAGAQVFEMSIPGTITMIKAYITNYPPGSDSSKFKWILKDATNFDIANIDSLPIITSGNAWSISYYYPYVAPPTILTSDANVNVEIGQRLLLQICEGAEMLAWNSGIGYLPGGNYTYSDGTWEEIWCSNFCEFGREIWVFDKVNINDIHNQVPDGFPLSQNYPNPFNPTTTISFSLKEPQFVTLKVYDLLGREIQTVVNKHLQTGTHDFIFDASRLSSGVYFYRFQAGDYTESKRMVLLK